MKQQISVMLNHHSKNKFKGNFGVYNSSFQLHTLTVREWLTEIRKGYAFCPVFSQNRRIKANFVEAWHIALDFDTCDIHSALETLSQSSLSHLASFAYTTPSHTDDKPKARLVFVFDTPITDGKRYERLYSALLDIYPHADTAARDCVRLFYGSENCDVWENWAVMDSGTVQSLIDSHTAKLNEKRTATPNRQTVRLKPTDTRAGSTFEKIFDKLLEHLANATKGERHQTRLKIGRTIGGYVAGGYISFHDAIDAAVGVMATDTPHKAKHEITAAIEYGRNEPITIEVETFKKPQSNVPTQDFGDTLRTIDGRSIIIQYVYPDGLIAGTCADCADIFDTDIYRITDGIAHQISATL